VLSAGPRWQLYRVLSEPVRLRLLAIAAMEELGVGELATLLGESQPNVSRHLGPLRQAALLDDRREGTRVLVRLAEGVERDPVVADALEVGRTLCEKEGLVERVREILRDREATTRDFFLHAGTIDSADLGQELPACLYALGGLVDQRQLAVDAGTGQGVMLDVLAPVFERVIAIDRSPVQLERAAERIRLRGYENVELVEDELDGVEAHRLVAGAADLVFSARVLHHARSPRQTIRILAEFVRPGGRLVLVDYRTHQDELWRQQQADVWMGFDPAELSGLAQAVGLVEAIVRTIPPGYAGRGVDARRAWLALTARRPSPVLGPRPTEPVVSADPPPGRDASNHRPALAPQTGPHGPEPVWSPPCPSPKSCRNPPTITSKTLA
jgi:DNA-binding transcriptional ArsR family regulator/SAM-dependent methyltransferase